MSVPLLPYRVVQPDQEYDHRNNRWRSREPVDYDPAQADLHFLEPHLNYSDIINTGRHREHLVWHGRLLQAKYRFLNGEDLALILLLPVAAYCRLEIAGCSPPGARLDRVFQPAAARMFYEMPRIQWNIDDSARRRPPAFQRKRNQSRIDSDRIAAAVRRQINRRLRNYERTGEPGAYRPDRRHFRIMREADDIHIGSPTAGYAGEWHRKLAEIPGWPGGLTDIPQTL